MKAIFKVFETAIDKINKYSLYLAAIFIFLSTFLAAVNAILRFSIGAGFPWSEELSSYFVVMLVFIALPNLEYTNRQLSIGVLNSFVHNPTVLKGIAIFRGLITLGFLGMLVKLGIDITQKAHMRETVTFVLQMPRFLLYGTVTLFFVIAILSWVIVICKKGEFKNAD